MIRVGIWERDEGLCDAIFRGTRGLAVPPTLFSGRHPADFSLQTFQLLVISPNAIGLAGAGAVKAKTVLLPGFTGGLGGALRAESAVSYGTSPKDTLTLSSLEGEKICLALQRELVTVEGDVVERQEFILPYPAARETPQHFMAQVGALLLLGCAVG